MQFSDAIKGVLVPNNITSSNNSIIFYVHFYEN